MRIPILSNITSLYYKIRFYTGINKNMYEKLAEFEKEWLDKAVEKYNKLTEKYETCKKQKHLLEKEEEQIEKELAELKKEEDYYLNDIRIAF